MEEEEKKPEEVPDTQAQTQVSWPVEVQLDVVINGDRYMGTVKVLEGRRFGSLERVL